MKLYEIPAAYREWENKVEDAGGEITPELEDELAGLDATLEVKVDAISSLVREADGRRDYFKAEASRLLDRASVEGNKSERLKAYLKQTLEELGKEKVVASLFTARIQRNGQPSTTILTPAEKLPEAFRRVEIVPDKDAIKAAWKRGEELPDGVSVVVGTHLRIV